MTDTSRPRRWVKPLSVRTRIVAVITVVAALGMLTVGVVVYLLERERNLAAIDDRLMANLSSARFIVEEGPVEGQNWETAEAALYAVVQRMSPDDNTGALGIVNGQTRLVPGVPLDLDLTSVPEFVPYIAGEVTPDGPVIGTYAEHGVVWRYIGAPVAVADDADQVVFTMAYDVEAELAELDSAIRAFVVGIIIALAIVALVATLVSTRLLRPLRRMRETAERVSAQSLDERLPIQGRDDVSELAMTMNDMLDRLDNALDSQRQLLSDVGHELKTPITIVRGNLEVVDTDDPADVRETVALVTDELDRMGRLVQDLAGAAALHGPSPVTPQQVDAGDLMRQVVRKAQAIEGATVTEGAIAEVVANVDPGRITQAMLQLAQNAVTHGGGQITIGSVAIGGDLDLWVRDRGPGVPDEVKPRVFDRFYRGGEGGSGLGLNIVHVIAKAHGGTAEVGDAVGGGALFSIRLPGAVSQAATWASDIVVPPRPPLPTRPESEGVTDGIDSDRRG